MYEGEEGEGREGEASGRPITRLEKVFWRPRFTDGGNGRCMAYGFWRPVDGGMLP